MNNHDDTDHASSTASHHCIAGAICNPIFRFLSDVLDQGIRPATPYRMLTAGEILCSYDEVVNNIVFPDGATTIGLRFGDEIKAEAAMIGFHDGIGLLSTLGSGRFSYQAVVLIGGPAWIISADHLRQAFTLSQPTQKLLLSYAQFGKTRLSRIAVCNATHSAEQRFARWILHLHGNLMSVQPQKPASTVSIPLKQETIADALGLQRSTLTTIMQKLQQQGAICMGRGRLFVLDRASLGAVSCNCQDFIDIARKKLM